MLSNSKVEAHRKSHFHSIPEIELEIAARLDRAPMSSVLDRDRHAALESLLPPSLLTLLPIAIATRLRHAINADTERLR
jgi:hypothetical protein